MSDDELRQLTADFADLTETAQQALRSEMRSRGLGDPEAARNRPTTNAPPSNAPSAPAAARVEPGPRPEYPGFYAGYFGRMPELVPDAPDGADGDGPHDYTWKTVLCDCDTNEQAQELSAALQQAGIESWIQEVAANSVRQLCRACLSPPISSIRRARIAARPIPPEIVAESQDETSRLHAAIMPQLRCPRPDS